MITIDGSEKSGSGTIVRYSAALAALLREELLLTNIRARREKPGLRPQHLRALQALAEVCQGRLEGAREGAHEIRFVPGPQVSSGPFEWDIGTAGSTTLLAMPLLPVACFSSKALTFRVSGGLFQDFAPSALHMQHAFLTILRRMGANVELDIVRPGYVPRGGGIIEVSVKPLGGGLKPVILASQGRVTRVAGVALSSHLRERRVSHRMAEECARLLRGRGYNPLIQPVYDETAPQAGAALAVFAHTDTGCVLGADRAGAPGRQSEEVGRHVAGGLLQDLGTGATVDRFLADQLIIFAALAEGTSEYVIPRMTEHVDTNLWLVQSILGAGVEMVGNVLRVRGVGLGPR